MRSPHLCPESSLAFDPVRLLRVLRFAARFDFRVDEALLKAAQTAAVRQALRELWETQRGRVLFELKKAREEIQDMVVIKIDV